VSAAHQEASPVLAEVVRSGVVESRHRGRAVLLHADGAVAWTAGDVEEPVLARSTTKPFQAVAMVRAGLRADPELLAVAAASHDGTSAALAAVSRLLDLGRLAEDDLGCPTAYPGSATERDAWLARGWAPRRAAMNCSGTHAGLLATCRANGWPTLAYLRDDHPVQQAVARELASAAGEPVPFTGVDGCGAPVSAASLVGLARAARSLALAGPASPGRAVADAMRAHPQLVAGEGRDVTVAMAATPGLLAKDGAEGVFLAASGDGRAVALKIDDGAERARVAAAAALLGWLGAPLGTPVVLLGAGRPVGSVRASALLAAATGAPDPS